MLSLLNGSVTLISGRASLVTKFYNKERNLRPDKEVGGYGNF